MTMEQFINKVSNAVRAYFGGGLDITVQKVMKNNGVEMTGLIFMEKGSDIAATIYLDSYYEAYGEGTPLGEIVRKLIRTYEEHRPAEKLNLDPLRFRVTEQEDLKDYLYDGDALRTLAGKKLHKKKNNVNAFMREYEGRFEYRKLCCSDRDDVWRFLDRWREQKGEEVEEHLDYEVHGIHEILKNCSTLPVEMGGVYIDDKMEAFTIGSLNARENMAVIHIEKANPDIRGLYQYINREFLIHEFPDVKLVNREDDLGLEGLRKAKMSYNPVGFERKYLIEQIDYPQQPGRMEKE